MVGRKYKPIKTNGVKNRSTLDIGLLLKPINPDGVENRKPATRRPCGPTKVSPDNVSHALNDGFSMAYDLRPCLRCRRVRS